MLTKTSPAHKQDSPNPPHFPYTIGKRTQSKRQDLWDRNRLYTGDQGTVLRTSCHPTLHHTKTKPYTTILEAETRHRFYLHKELGLLVSKTGRQKWAPGSEGLWSSTSGLRYWHSSICPGKEEAGTEAWPRLKELTQHPGARNPQGTGSV